MISIWWVIPIVFVCTMLGFFMAAMCVMAGSGEDMTPQRREGEEFSPQRREENEGKPKEGNGNKD